jgi:hypothetical protein
MDERALRVGVTLVIFMSAVGPAAASAQPVYVGASLVADVSRFTTIEIEPSAFSSELTEGGETLGFSLVAGTALGERWGVELEFVRPGVIEHVIEREFPLFPPAIPLPQPIPLPRPIPIVAYEVRSEERHTTLTPAVWFRQPIGGRAELCYLGGVAFVRTTREQEVAIDPRVLAIGLSIPVEQEIVEHTVGPMVGIEGRIRMTRQLALTPGIRLVAVTGDRNGWLTRPGVGVHWRF